MDISSKTAGLILKNIQSLKNAATGIAIMPADFLPEEAYSKADQLVVEIDTKVGELLELFATRGGTIELPAFLKARREEYFKQNG